MDDTLSNLYFLGLDPVNSRRRRKELSGNNLNIFHPDSGRL